MTKLRKLKTKAFCRQLGRCCYCKCLMWDADAKRFRIEHGLAESDLTLFQATAEHLIARCDGGLDSLENIVAACRHCNLTRHQMGDVAMKPKAYRAYVARAVARGEWPTSRLLADAMQTRSHEPATATVAPQPCIDDRLTLIA